MPWLLFEDGSSGRLACSSKSCGGGSSGGSQGDGDGYTAFEMAAVTSSRLRAGSLGPSQGLCHALDEMPPVEPPERTSVTEERAQGLKGLEA